MKLVFCGLCCGVALLSADFWNDKEPAQWSEKEVERLLTKSPWAKQVVGAMDFSRMGSGPGGMPGGGPPGGGMPGGGGPPPGMGPGGGGMPGGGGPPPGMGPGGGGMPEFKATVRWESAAPLRAAGKRGLPDDTADSYIVSITGLPMNGRGDAESAARRKQMLEQMKTSTSLKGRGKNQLSPSKVHVDESSGTMYFSFAKDSEVVSPEAKEVVFTALLGPLEFKAKFSPKEMKYKGQPAL